MSLENHLAGLAYQLETQLQGPNQWWSQFQAKNALGDESRVDFYNMIAAMLRGNLPLSSCLEKLLLSYQKPGDSMAVVLRSWISKLEAGKTFSEALEGWVPKSELILISAGERSNNLAIALDQAARGIKAVAAIKSAFIKALAYPLGIIVFVVALLGFFSSQMQPIITQSFKITDFPGYTQTLFSVGGFIANYYILLIILGVSGVSLIAWSMNSWKGQWRDRADHIAPWSIFRTYNSATFLLSLSALLQAGIPLNMALQEIRAMSSTWMKAHIDKCSALLETGASYREVFNSNMLDDKVRILIAVYADLTEFEKAILSIGNVTIENSIETVNRKAGTAKVLTTVLAACLIGWIVAGTMSIQSAASRMTTSAQSQR